MTPLKRSCASLSRMKAPRYRMYTLLNSGHWNRMRSTENMGMNSPRSTGCIWLVWKPWWYRKSVRKPMLTWRAFRGISCLWTNARHSRCTGIKPNGLGLRERFLQYADPKPCGTALAGESRSFSFISCLAEPFERTFSPDFPLVLTELSGSAVFAAVVVPPLAVILNASRWICGLLLLLLARRKSGCVSSCTPNSLCPSFACSSIGATDASTRLCFDRVVGGK